MDDELINLVSSDNIDDIDDNTEIIQDIILKADRMINQLIKLAGNSSEDPYVRKRALNCLAEMRLPALDEIVLELIRPMYFSEHSNDMLKITAIANACHLKPNSREFFKKEIRRINFAEPPRVASAVKAFLNS